MLFIPAFFLILSGFIAGQDDDRPMSELLALGHDVTGEVYVFNDHLAVSAGFADSEFFDSIGIQPGESSSDLLLKTSYLKPLQYTISNVEGIILDRGRFIGEQDLDFSRKTEGDYAVYIFAANRVVRAFMVSKDDRSTKNLY